MKTNNNKTNNESNNESILTNKNEIIEQFEKLVNSEPQKRKEGELTACQVFDVVNKNAKLEQRKRDGELSNVLARINESAKIAGSDVRRFFGVVGLSIAPNDKSKMDTKRVYLTTALIKDIYTELGLYIDGRFVKAVAKRDENGKIVKDGKFTVYEFKPLEAFTPSRVFDILTKNAKIVYTSVKKAVNKARKIDKANKPNKTAKAA